MIKGVIATVACTATVALSSTAPLGAAAADDAAALIAKHQQYVGWSSGDGVVKTLRESGVSLDPTGRVMVNFEVLRYGIAYRETGGSSFRNAHGFTGSAFWSTGNNGFILKMSGDAVRYEIAQQTILGETTSTYTPSVLRHDVVGGVDTVVLRLTHQVGYPIEVYVDPATGAFKRAVIDANGRYRLTFDDLTYAEVQGKRFISGYRLGGGRLSIRYDKIEVNPEIAADAVRPPKPTATWTFGEGTVPIEFRTRDLERIYFDATMNGVKGRFMLDTGAGATLISNEFARRIGGKPIGRASATGIGGDVHGSQYRVDTMQIGSSVLHDLVVNGGGSEDDAGEKVDGLLGFDLLAGAIVELNLDRKTLEIMDPAKVAPDENRGIVLRPDLLTGQIRIPMRLNGKYDVLGVLDSGNALNVLLPKDFVHANRIALTADPDQGSSFYGGGVGANYEIERCGMIESLSLGPIQYKPVPACDSDYMRGNQVLVGLDFMKAFNYVFDYPDGIILLMKRGS